jgi:HD-like signal output (HDOD) protein
MTTMGSPTSVDKLCEVLLQQFERPEYQPPPLPDVATQLMLLCSQPQVSAAQIVGVLERDQMLAAAVLRLVQSPLYAGRSVVSSLSDAVVRLGINLIRDIVFEVSLRQGVFNLPEFKEIMGQLNRHSTVSAYLSRVVSKHVGATESSSIFLCGLLHDVGFAGLLFGISDQRGFRGPDALINSWEAIDRAHERASGKLARIWALPEELCAVIGNHHHYAQAGEFWRSAAIVQVAEALSVDFGADVLGPTASPGQLASADAPADSDVAAARAALRIDDAVWERIQAEAERVIPNVLWI